MTKLIALAAAGILAAGTVLAGEHGDCARQVGNKDKAACHVSMANLNLTAEQKAKMDKAMDEHHKAGCNEASEAKFMTAAEGILTKEQFATFKAEAKGGKAKTEA
jgi:Spy/CpxP family protein refolding chaperone